MKKIVEFLAQHRDIEFVGFKLGVESDVTVVWAAPRALGNGFRLHNVGDIDNVTKYLKCNPEAESLKVALQDDGRLIVRSVASIADQKFEIDGYVGFDSDVSAQQQFQEWLDNFSKKLADTRRKFSARHA